jgi:PhnB protein
MNSPVKTIPDGYAAATPYLTISGASEAIEFYKKAFGATERMRLADPGGRIMHAEIQVGDAVLMLHEEMPDWPARSPTTIGDTGSSVMLYVPDVDAFVARAVEAGAQLTMPVQTQFYGDRTGNIVDPFGHKWLIATHVEDVSPEEVGRRAAQMFGSAP